MNYFFNVIKHLLILSIFFGSAFAVAVYIWASESGHSNLADQSLSLILQCVGAFVVLAITDKIFTPPK